MIKKILLIIFILLSLTINRIYAADSNIKLTDLIYDNSSKIIFLQAYNTLEDVKKLNVESKSLDNPKRTFFDINNAILTGGSIVYNFKNSPVEKVILAQNNVNPNVVRLTFYHNDNIDLSKVELLKLKNGLIFKLDSINIPDTSLHRSFREEKSLSSDFIEKLTFLKQISNNKVNNETQNKTTTSLINNPEGNVKQTGEDVLSSIFIPDDTKRLRSKSYIQKLSVRNGNILLNGIGNITVEKPIILSNPSRIAFDLANAVVAKDLKNKTFNISENEKVVISQFEPTKVRVVVYTDKVNEYTSVFSFDLQSLLIVNKNRISNVKLSEHISKLKSFTISNYNVEDKNLTFEFNNPCVFSYIRNDNNVEFIIYNGSFSDLTKIKTTLSNSYENSKVESYGRSIIKITININKNNKTEFFETTNGKKAVILIKNPMMKTKPINIGKDDDNNFVIPENVDKKLIVLDAGHGGSDVGATRNGIYEKDINLDVTNRLARMLTKKGFKIVLTRKEDETVSLQERVEVSNAKRPVLFMSVHVNASVNEAVSGVETHYWKDNSVDYANVVQKHLSTIDSPARGVVKSKFYVINHTEAPAVLVEIGFISNTQERNELISDKRKEQTAKVLADAIVEYLKTVK